MPRIPAASIRRTSPEIGDHPHFLADQPGPRRARARFGASSHRRSASAALALAMSVDAAHPLAVARCGDQTLPKSGSPVQGVVALGPGLSGPGVPEPDGLAVVLISIRWPCFWVVASAGFSMVIVSTPSLNCADTAPGSTW